MVVSMLFFWVRWSVNLFSRLALLTETGKSKLVIKIKIKVVFSNVFYFIRIRIDFRIYQWNLTCWIDCLILLFHWIQELLLTPIQPKEPKGLETTLRIVCSCCCPAKEMLTPVVAMLHLKCYRDRLLEPRKLMPNQTIYQLILHHRISVQSVPCMMYLYDPPCTVPLISCD